MNVDDEMRTSILILESALMGPDPLLSLRACRSLQTTLAAEVQNRAFDAHAQGATWDHIGSALGMTGRAAQQRFGKDT
jgi:hypothetical protein